MNGRGKAEETSGAVEKAPYLPQILLSPLSSSSFERLRIFRISS